LRELRIMPATLDFAGTGTSPSLRAQRSNPEGLRETSWVASLRSQRRAGHWTPIAQSLMWSPGPGETPGR
jgi:hypothetical protein